MKATRVTNELASPQEIFSKFKTRLEGVLALPKWNSATYRTSLKHILEPLEKFDLNNLDDLTDVYQLLLTYCLLGIGSTGFTTIANDFKTALLDSAIRPTALHIKEEVTKQGATLNANPERFLRAEDSIKRHAEHAEGEEAFGVYFRLRAYSYQEYAKRLQAENQGYGPEIMELQQNMQLLLDSAETQKQKFEAVTAELAAVKAQLILAQALNAQLVAPQMPVESRPSATNGAVSFSQPRVSAAPQAMFPAPTSRFPQKPQSKPRTSARDDDTCSVTSGMTNVSNISALTAVTNANSITTVDEFCDALPAALLQLRDSEDEDLKNLMNLRSEVIHNTIKFAKTSLDMQRVAGVISKQEPGIEGKFLATLCEKLILEGGSVAGIIAGIRQQSEFQQLPKSIVTFCETQLRLDLVAVGTEDQGISGTSDENVATLSNIHNFMYGSTAAGKREVPRLLRSSLDKTRIIRQKHDDMREELKSSKSTSKGMK